MDKNRQKIEKIMGNHGFTLISTQEIPHRKAVLYQACYDKNGAELVWLDRKEENKTFAIAFKTIPGDDTGVFHILEHSVLCGSQKYPVSKPFVELMKSSLQTFMNAFTFPDKTMYPVCSRNQKDFLNLMDVYLDAVFHPLCVKEKNIFLQEGWHYEQEESGGEPRCNGVVYNEMKGMYTSPDTILASEMNRLLFPDNCYRFQSGGDPAHITDLTYENYVGSYRRFYHPSNARIILDGDMDLDAVLAKLEEVLDVYERRDIDSTIPFQKAVHPKDHVCYYEAGNQGAAQEKAILAEGWVYGRFDEPEKHIACDVLAQALCGSNEAPLKKALLEKGLAENVELTGMDGMQQFCINLVVRNTSEKKQEEVWSTVYETLQTLAKNGLDHKRLDAILNRMEFRMKEKEAGGFPEGVLNAMNMLNSWLYGGNPAQNLCFDQVFSSIRGQVETGYFERLIREALLENPHHARVVLLPLSAQADAERNKERSEQSRALPVLSLSDIPKVQEEIPQFVTKAGGNTVLSHALETDGITHISYYFRLDDMSPEELSQISFLRILLGQTATKHNGLSELETELEERTGRFETEMPVFSKPGQIKACKPYLAVHISVLEQQLEKAIGLIEEIFCNSEFCDESYIFSRLRQLRLSMEQHVLMAGNSYAAQCVLAEYSAKGVVKEAMQGIQMLRWVQKTERSFTENGQALLQNLQQLYRRIFVRERVTLSITGKLPEKDREWLLGVLPAGKDRIGSKVEHKLLPVEKRGILIPSEIGFAAKGGNIGMCGASYDGAMKVAARVLSYGYLWDTIRVKGGAYGTGLSISEEGDVVFSSFRDPAALDSIASFDGAGSALRDLVESGEALDRYIISTIAATEPLLGARRKGNLAAQDYFCGITAQMRQKMRSEILHTNREKLIWISELLDELCKGAGVCVIGGESVFDSEKHTFTEVESL